MLQNVPNTAASKSTLGYTAAEPYQRKLTCAALMIAVLSSTIIGGINVFNFQAWLIAGYNGLTAVSSLAALIYLYRGGRLAVAAWTTVIVVLLNLAVFLSATAGAAYSFIWITIVPPLAFFLLGRQLGTLITAIGFGFVVYVMLAKTPWGEPMEFTLGAFLNIIEVFILHLLLFRYYEKSRHDAYEALAIISKTDKLTGLYNRQTIDSYLQQYIEQATANAGPMCAVLIDIDHFKAINDTYGHLAGDKVLKHVGHVLNSQLRDDEVVGRWGGEEFLLLLPNTTDDQALTVADRVREHIQHNRSLRTPVTASMGIAQWQAGDTPTDWIARADSALYQAKHAGRNRCEIYTAPT